MKLFRILILFNVLFPALACAQVGMTAIAFLQLSPSPSLNSMGSVGTSLPGNDVFSFYHNPAHLAGAEAVNSLSFQLFPEKTDWMGQLTGREITINSTGAALGWKFDKLIPGFPIRAGAGYMRSVMDLGLPLYLRAYDKTLKDMEEYTAFGAAAGFDYYVSVQIGLSYKIIKSTLTYGVMGGPLSQVGSSTVETSAMDYGLLITAPVTRLLKNPFIFQYKRSLQAIPFLSFSLGYDQRNVGDEVYYFHRQQKDPVGRTAVLGYSISAGLDIELDQNEFFRILKMDWAVEAEDLLIKSRNETAGEPGFEYQSGLGDIDLGWNIVQIRSSADVTARKGLRLEVAEIIQISAGSFDGRGYDNRSSNGYGIRTKGLFHLFRHLGSVAAFMDSHIDIRYFVCSYFDNSYYQSKQKALSLNISNIESIFW